MTHPRHFGLHNPPDWQPEEPRAFDEAPSLAAVYIKFAVIVFGAVCFLSLCFFYLLKGMAV